MVYSAEMNAPRAGSTRFAIRNNSRIAYDPGREPEESGNPAIVLLHDLLADRTAFSAQRAALGVASRVITPDARGHGASATLANQWYTMAELAQDVVAILDVEEIPTVHLVGHGLGGATSFEIARRFPERVATLTMIEPALFGVLDNDLSPAAVGARNELRSSDRAAGDAAYKGLTDRALDTYLLPRWGSGWRETPTKVRLGAIRRHASSLAGLLPAIDGYTVAKNELRLFLVPTRIVLGTDAHPVARLSAERLAANLPAAGIDTIELNDRPNTPFSGSGAEQLNPLLTGFLFDQ